MHLFFLLPCHYIFILDSPILKTWGVYNVLHVNIDSSNFLYVSMY